VAVPFVQPNAMTGRAGHFQNEGILNPPLGTRVVEKTFQAFGQQLCGQMDFISRHFSARGGSVATSCANGGKGFGLSFSFR
jgi:hypothetical protein